MTVLAGAPIQPGRGHQAGRQLLGQLYRETTGEEMPDILVEAGGKPRFAWGERHFSITHTEAHVFVALSDSPVGLDAEELTRQVNPALAEKILSPAEHARYLEAADRNLALLSFWVLKEAQGKLTGEGVRPWPNCTDFSLKDPRLFTRDGCILALFEQGDAV